MIKFEEKKKAITRMKPIRENKTQEQIDDRPLMTPRIRSPLKKGRKQIKFHTVAKTPLGGSISLSLLTPYPTRSPPNNYIPISESTPIPTCNHKKYTIFNNSSNKIKYHETKK